MEVYTINMYHTCCIVVGGGSPKTKHPNADIYIFFDVRQNCGVDVFGYLLEMFSGMEAQKPKC